MATSSTSKTKAKAKPKARSAARADKSVEAYRDALERSLAASREWIQEVMDDAVKRGRLQRRDANEIVTELVERGRKQTQELIKELERSLAQARKDIDRQAKKTRRQIEAQAKKARRQAERLGGRATKTVRDVADEPLARADKLRRRAGVGEFPITGYDHLTAAQAKARLGDLTKADLRKVRTHEKAGKARKSILDAIEKALA